MTLSQPVEPTPRKKIGKAQGRSVEEWIGRTPDEGRNRQFERGRP